MSQAQFISFWYCCSFTTILPAGSADTPVAIDPQGGVEVTPTIHHRNELMDTIGFFLNTPEK